MTQVPKQNTTVQGTGEKLIRDVLTMNLSGRVDLHIGGEPVKICQRTMMRMLDAGHKLRLDLMYVTVLTLVLAVPDQDLTCHQTSGN